MSWFMPSGGDFVGPLFTVGVGVLCVAVAALYFNSRARVTRKGHGGLTRVFWNASTSTGTVSSSPPPKHILSGEGKVSSHGKFVDKYATPWNNAEIGERQEGTYEPATGELFRRLNFSPPGQQNEVLDLQQSAHGETKSQRNKHGPGPAEVHVGMAPRVTQTDGNRKKRGRGEQVTDNVYLNGAGLYVVKNDLSENLAVESKRRRVGNAVAASANHIVAEGNDFEMEIESVASSEGRNNNRRGPCEKVWEKKKVVWRKDDVPLRTKLYLADVQENKKRSRQMMEQSAPCASSPSSAFGVFVSRLKKKPRTSAAPTATLNLGLDAGNEKRVHFDETKNEFQSAPKFSSIPSSNSRIGEAGKLSATNTILPVAGSAFVFKNSSSNGSVGNLKAPDGAGKGTVGEGASSNPKPFSFQANPTEQQKPPSPGPAKARHEVSAGESGDAPKTAGAFKFGAPVAPGKGPNDKTAVAGRFKFGATTGLKTGSSDNTKAAGGFQSGGDTGSAGAQKPSAALKTARGFQFGGNAGSVGTQKTSEAPKAAGGFQFGGNAGSVGTQNTSEAPKAAGGFQFGGNAGSVGTQKTSEAPKAAGGFQFGGNVGSVGTQKTSEAPKAAGGFQFGGNAGSVGTQKTSAAPKAVGGFQFGTKAPLLNQAPSGTIFQSKSNPGNTGGDSFNLNNNRGTKSLFETNSRSDSLNLLKQRLGAGKAAQTKRQNATGGAKAFVNTPAQQSGNMLPPKAQQAGNATTTFSQNPSGFPKPQTQQFGNAPTQFNQTPGGFPKPQTQQFGNAPGNAFQQQAQQTANQPAAAHNFPGQSAQRFISGGKPGNVKPCRFDPNCHRADCYFNHPQRDSGNGGGNTGSTEQNSGGKPGNVKPCRFDPNCHRAGCYFSHPKRDAAGSRQQQPPGMPSASAFGQTPFGQPSRPNSDGKLHNGSRQQNINTLKSRMKRSPDTNQFQNPNPFQNQQPPSSGFSRGNNRQRKKVRPRKKKGR